jgi:thymidylate synthase (FAD)
MNKLGTIDDIFGDGIAKVEAYDFSRANLNDKSRVNAVSLIASICYQNKKSIGSESLYNRLIAESIGLPSSSFEFVPVLIANDMMEKFFERFFDETNPLKVMHIGKYGELIEDYGILTNLRALMADVGPEASKEFYNTEEECEIIAKYYKVYHYDVDLPTRSQMERHRVSWQELSRRYVSGERVPFQFYVSEKMHDVISEVGEYAFDTESILAICLNHYQEAIKAGVKPQEARRIIPQAAYTEMWAAFYPSQLENFYGLRLDSHSQWEIQQVAKAMKTLDNKAFDDLEDTTDV